MKIDVTKMLKTSTQDTTISIRELANNALFMARPGTAPVEQTERIRKLILSEDQPDMKAEDVAVLKQIVAGFAVNGVVAQFNDLVDPPAKG